jgi:isopenicillin-N epimerase
MLMSNLDFHSARDWSSLRRHWLLRPDVIYLNHGAFGPSPRRVLEARRQWAERLAGDPWDFLARQMAGHLAEARARLGRFVGAGGDDLIFVENATVGMNIVAASTPLAPGDEVLATNHEYGAVLRLWDRACTRSGAQLVIHPLTVPFTSGEQVVESLMSAVTPRTRLLVFSHVSSPTAVILPAAEICRAARDRGLMVCIDGPHAPVQVPLNISALDCDYYTASCHKWLAAPFGSGFLYVHPRVQSRVQPVVVSWGHTPGESAFSWRDEFIWTGTRDPTAFLAVPAAIEFIESLGLDEFRRRTHALARQAREQITALTGLEPLTPDEHRWFGSMASLPLPPGEAQPLQDALWQRFGIEVPIFAWGEQRLVRVSCHAYNTAQEVERLVDALRTVLP